MDNEKSEVDIYLDKLANAVAIAETSGCTQGAGQTHNNCFGIMKFDKGGRKYKYYNSKEESYKDFKKIWSKYYCVPTCEVNYKKAKIWTGNDRVNNWLKNVKENLF